MIKGIIYKYISPIGKIYIGQTTNERRRRKTFLNLNKSYGGTKIDAARHKYKPENFEYEIIHIENFDTKAEATKKIDELEEQYITKFDTYKNGYNMTFGGYTNRGFRYTPEQRRIMSISRIGKKLKPLSEEQKLNHSYLMKYKWQTLEYRSLREAIIKTPEHQQKRSESVSGDKNGMYGKSHTTEAKLKMSESRFGEKNYWFSKEKPIETKEKISQSLKKHHETNVISDETKRKISEGCSTSVSQYSLRGEYMDTFTSIALAGKLLAIDSSCITKCCKGKRTSAGGFRWKYADVNTNQNIVNGMLSADSEWITTAEAVRLTGRCRNVLYYHIKNHGIPKITIGRKIKINRKALIDLFKIIE